MSLRDPAFIRLVRNSAYAQGEVRALRLDDSPVHRGAHPEERPATTYREAAVLLGLAGFWDHIQLLAGQTLRQVHVSPPPNPQDRSDELTGDDAIGGGTCEPP